jgi:hypothetical protein
VKLVFRVRLSSEVEQETAMESGGQIAKKTEG